MLSEQKLVHKTLGMWSNLVVIYATVLIAYGAPLLNLHYDDPELSRRMRAFASLLLTVGLSGVAAGMFKKRSLVLIQTVLLFVLAGVTLQLVSHRLQQTKAGCPEKATSVVEAHHHVFMEIFPGLSVEIGTQTAYFISFDEEKMKDCLSKVHELWVHSTLLLAQVLISCVICSWRFYLAIDAAEAAYGEREVPCTVIDEHGRVTETTKMLEMPPPMPEFEGVKPVYV